MDLHEVWNSRNEELIQDCLEEAFTKKGYRVTNNHKSDRSHENGVDLVCEDPDETINIQVKVKPSKEDVEQLGRLSKSVSNKKIYVYVEDPTSKFSESMNQHEEVEFWDRSHLHKFLIENNSNLYFRIFFLSMPIVKRIVSTLKKIIRYGSVEPNSLEDQQMRLWWIFKDRSVKLHAAFQLIKDIYSRELLEKDIYNLEDVKFYIQKISNDFNSIDVNSGRDLENIIDDIGKRFPQILSQYVQVTMRNGRSNWIGMRADVNESIANRMIEDWVIPLDSESSSYYNQMVFYLDNLEEISNAIEDGVDWVAEKRFGPV